MKILIATDGSEYSKAAVEECCKFLVDPKGSEFKIVSIFEDVYVMSGEPFSISDDYYLKLLDAVESQAQRFVRDTVSIIKQNLGDKVGDIHTEVIKGNADEKILAIARDWGADVIVVGSHGRNFWGRLLGSVSDAVVHHAPCSVLVVRPRHKLPAATAISA
jgi:nucleotide-binding universal stress UspA family protein